MACQRHAEDGHICSKNQKQLPAGLIPDGSLLDTAEIAVLNLETRFLIRGKSL
jgi:hypothetical protein